MSASLSRQSQGDKTWETAVSQHLTGSELAVCWSGLTAEGRQTCEEEKQAGARSGTPWEQLHGAREHSSQGGTSLPWCVRRRQQNEMARVLSSPNSARLSMEKAPSKVSFLSARHPAPAMTMAEPRLSHPSARVTPCQALAGSAQSRSGCGACGDHRPADDNTPGYVRRSPTGPFQRSQQQHHPELQTPSRHESECAHHPSTSPSLRTVGAAGVWGI